jgi:spore coat polysaccharide biosynthesis protein SpsF (cytidylyltransferase family)
VPQLLINFMTHKNLCIIQARMGSTRLPGKVLKKINGVAMLEYEINRVKQSRKINKIVVATSNKKADAKIEALCKKIKVDCFRGSEEDVLDRYYQCSLLYPQYKNIIRVTGDCPLIDPAVIDQVIALFEKGGYDYASNVQKETFPDGMDNEIFTRKALEWTAKNARLQSEREFVTWHIRNSDKFKKGNLAAECDWSHFRLTVDEQSDFEVIKFLIKNSKLTDGYLRYISLLTKNPRIMFKNTHIIRNEGLLKVLKKDFIVR